MNSQFRKGLLASTLFVSASLVAAPAFAQDVPAPTPSPADNAATPDIPETTTPMEGQTVVPSTSAEGENVETAQDIVVTGSRIPQPNLTSASPVTVVTDANTAELARLMQRRFHARWGTYPHVVVNRLSRRKLDAREREALDAVQRALLGGSGSQPSNPPLRGQ